VTEYLPLKRIQTGSEAHPTHYLMSVGGSFPGVEHLGHEDDCSAPSSAESKNVNSYNSTLPHTFMKYLYFVLTKLLSRHVNM
jgi:hypothetical protein